MDASAAELVKAIALVVLAIASLIYVAKRTLNVRMGASTAKNDAEVTDFDDDDDDDAADDAADGADDDDPRSPEERAYVAQFGTEDQVTMLKRKAREYFSVIESLQAERDEWIKMWRLQSAEHMTAQYILERELVSTRQVSARAIMELNKMRKKQNLPLVTRPNDLADYLGEPVGNFEKYAKRMMKLRDELMPGIDGRAERDRIAVDLEVEVVEVGDVAS